MTNFVRSISTKGRTFGLLWILLLTGTNLFAQLCDFGYSKPITIQHNSVAGNVPHQNFPVLIQLVDEDLRHIAKGGHVSNLLGHDIGFISMNGNALDHELVAYDSLTGALSAWVRIPLLKTDENTTIQLVYGSGNTNGDPSVASTWPNQYGGVWHLEGAAPLIKESTFMGNHASRNGSLDSTGKIIGKMGFALRFNGIDDFLSLSSGLESVLGKTGALSFWIRSEQVGGFSPETSPGFLGYDQFGTDNSLYFGWLTPQTHLAANTGTGPTSVTNAALSIQEWQHMVITRDYTNGLIRIFQNGILSDSSFSSPGIKTVPLFNFGRIDDAAGSPMFFAGDLDEIKLYHSIPNAAWIQTEYSNQAFPESFFRVGKEKQGTFQPAYQTCNFGHKKRLTIPASQVVGTGNLSDFPVLVSLTDLNLRSVSNGGHVIHSQGYDILFTDNKGVRMAHQMEFYDPAQGEIRAWVKVPLLSGTTDSKLHLFYGNEQILSDPSTSCVWSNGYAGVWHFNGDVTDASGSKNHGTDMGTSHLSNAPIGPGRDFAGNGQYVNVGPVGSGLSQFSMSAWLKKDAFGEDRIFCVATGTAPGDHILSLGTVDNGGSNGLNVLLNPVGGTAVDAIGLSPFPNNSWKLVSMTYDGGIVKIYLDNQLVGSSITSGPLPVFSQPAIIGNINEVDDRYLDGQMDEIHFSNVARTSDWIATEFNNQNSPGPFVLHGPEIALLPINSAQNGNWHDANTWAGGLIPEVGFKTVVHHQVNLQSGDAAICNLEVSNASGTHAMLRILNGNLLHIDADALISSPDNQPFSSGLSLEGINTKMLIRGNLDFYRGPTDLQSLPLALTLTDTSELTVEGNLIYNYLGSGTDETLAEIFLNKHASASIEGDVVVNCDGGNNWEMELSEMAEFTVDGTFSVNQTSGNNVKIQLEGTSILSIFGQLNANISGGSDFEIDLSLVGNAGFLKVGQDVVVNKTGGGNFKINQYDLSKFEIGRSFLFDWSHVGVDNKQLEFNMGGNSLLRIGKNLNISIDDTLATNCNLQFQLSGIAAIEVGADTGMLVDSARIHLVNGNDLTFDLQQSARFKVHGDLSLIQSGSGNTTLALNQNSLGVAAFKVGGDFNLQKTAGDSLKILCSHQSFWDISGSATIAVSGHDLPLQNSVIHLEDEGRFIVDESFSFLLDVPNNNSMIVDIDDKGLFAIGSNISPVNDTGLFEVRNGQNLEITIDGDGELRVIGELRLNMNGTGDGQLYFNHYEQGSAADAQLVVWRGMEVLKTNGGDFDISLRDGSDLVTVSSLQITSEGYVAPDKNFNFTLGDNSSADIGGHFLITSGGAFDNTFNLDVINNATIDVGINPIALFYNAVIKTTGGGGAHVNLDQNSRMRVFGNMVLNKSGGDFLDVALNKFSGSNSQLLVYGGLDFDNMNNTGCVGLSLEGSNSILKVGKNVSFFDVQDTGRAAIELKGQSCFQFGGSVIRKPIPNQYGRIISHGADSIFLDGKHPQFLASTDSDNSDSISYSHLIIKNTSNLFPQIIAEGNVTVNSSIHLRDGILQTSPPAKLILPDNAVLTNPDTTSYVNGPIRKYGDDPFVFPVGSRSHRAQIGISAPDSINAVFEASYYWSNPSDSGYSVNSKASGIEEISTQEYWQLDRVAGNDSVFVTLYWENGGVNDIQSLAELRVAHWEGGEWQDEGQSGTSGFPGQGQSGSITTLSKMGSFSPITFGSTSSNANPLPVELLWFNAQPTQNGVELKWATATETNSAHFIVERSHNGIETAEITRIEAAGKSQSLKEYAALDANPLPGTSYYRLVQVDLNGEQESTAWEVVYRQNAKDGIRIYAVEGTDRSYFIEVGQSPIEHLEVLDLVGYSHPHHLRMTNSAGIQYRLDLPSALPTGVYVVRLFANGKNEAVKLLVR